jgi:hypothetical protein
MLIFAGLERAGSVSFYAEAVEACLSEWWSENESCTLSRPIT